MGVVASRRWLNTKCSNYMLATPPPHTHTHIQIQIQPPSSTAPSCIFIHFFIYTFLISILSPSLGLSPFLLHYGSTHFL